MRLDKKLKVDLERIIHHYDGETKTRIVTPQIAFRVKEEDAEKLLGQAFYAAVFGAMTVKSSAGDKAKDEAKQTDIEGKEEEAAQSVLFPWKSPLKLAAVFEQHRVDLLEKSYTVTPEAPIVTAVEDEPAVIVHLRLPMPGDSKTLHGALGTSYGETIEVKFTPSNEQLPGIDEDAGRVLNRRSGPWGNNKPTVAK